MKYVISVCSLLACIIFNVLAALPAYSQKARFAYDVDFEVNFDNREYSVSRFSSSRTIFGARLTPSVGLELDERSGNGRHFIMAGIDVMKDFGDSPVSPSVTGDSSSGELSSSKENWDLFHEITLYYRYFLTKGRTEIGITAGIFPRRFMEGEYSRAFFSDSLRFYDNNIEGMMFSFTRPSSYFEIGCDWMGMFGTDRRERFMIFSSGHGSLSEMFSLGYAAYLYHFAGSENVSGVVDNALVNPYATLDLSRRTGLQRLDFRLGYLQSMQNDRKNIGKYTFPLGGEFTVSVRNWNVGLENYLFYGTDMMPYYRNLDSGGIMYGDLLYMGEPFYKVKLDGDGAGLYDRVEVYYEPRISDFLSIRASVVAHFNGCSYSGLQQVVTLKFNLGTLLQKNRSGQKPAPRPKVKIQERNLQGWII